MMHFDFVLILFVAFCFLIVGVSKVSLNFLSVLIYVEGFAVSSFFFLVFSVGGAAAVVFLTLVACESAWGISVMINLVRVKSNDYVRSFSTSVF